MAYRGDVDIRNAEIRRLVGCIRTLIGNSSPSAAQAVLHASLSRFEQDLNTTASAFQDDVDQVTARSPDTLVVDTGTPGPQAECALPNQDLQEFDNCETKITEVGVTDSSPHPGPRKDTQYASLIDTFFDLSSWPSQDPVSDTPNTIPLTITFSSPRLYIRSPTLAITLASPTLLPTPTSAMSLLFSPSDESVFCPTANTTDLWPLEALPLDLSLPGPDLGTLNSPVPSITTTLPPSPALDSRASTLVPPSPTCKALPMICFPIRTTTAKTTTKATSTTTAERKRRSTPINAGPASKRRKGDQGVVVEEGGNGDDSYDEDEGPVNAGARYSPRRGTRKRATRGRYPQTLRSRTRTQQTTARDEDEDEGPIISVPLSVTHLLTQIATYCREAAFPETPGGRPALFDVMDSFTQVNTSGEDLFRDNSLTNLIRCCERSEQLIYVSQFMYAVNTIQLTAKLYSMMLLEQKSRKALFRERCPKTYSEKQKNSLIRKWERHAHIGVRYCLLACAGSFYLLPLLAASGQDAAFRKLTMDEVPKLAKVLRAPVAPESLHKIITSDIIPTLEVMIHHYPIEFESMFGHASLVNQHIPAHLAMDKLGECDKFFQNIPYQCFVPGRHSDMWYCCLTESGNLFGNPTVDPTLFHSVNRRFLQWSSLRQSATEVVDPPSPCDELTDSEDESSIPLPLQPQGTIIDIKTDYNIKLNKCPDFHYENPRAHYVLTCNERTIASQATIPKTVQEMKAMIRQQLRSGKKLKRSDYVRIPRHLMLEYLFTPSLSISFLIGNSSKRLSISDKYGSPLVILSTTLPSQDRGQLQPTIDNTYPRRLKKIKSKDHKVIKEAEANHYNVYNRYAIHGKNVPPDQDPDVATRGSQGKPTHNHFIPRASTELRDHRLEYELLHTSLKPVFCWMEQELRTMVPELYEHLCKWPDSFPLQEYAPVYPFGGFVLNMNVSTRIHRDPGDDEICAVIPMMDGEGGELVLMELGLVLEVQTGDLVIFRSGDLSHFNLDYEGKRASFVFHSDKHSHSWIENANEWLHNTSFKELPFFYYQTATE